MNWISAVSDVSDYDKAISEISLDIKEKLNGKKADLVILFVSSHHSINYEKIASLFSKKSPRPENVDRLAEFFIKW